MSARLEKVPHVYRAIVAVSASLAARGIAKSQSNDEEGYQFRGIDDVYNALAPALVKHKLCILPRILARTCDERRGAAGDALFAVTIKAAFDLVSARDGSRHTVEVFAEAIDTGDKATNKAMSAAYKYVAFQAFCIPVAGGGDADQRTYSVLPFVSADTPVQGWEQWVIDVGDIANQCETLEALIRTQTTYRKELQTLSRAEPGLYAKFGQLILRRRRALSGASSGPNGPNFLTRLSPSDAMVNARPVMKVEVDATAASTS